MVNGETLPALHTRGGKQRHKIYTSPSVLYSELGIYTKPHLQRFNMQEARVVLQCRQKPDYEIGGETVGWNRKYPGRAISPHFDNSVIERFTTARNAIIPYRVLVKLGLPKTTIPKGTPGRIVGIRAAIDKQNASTEVTALPQEITMEHYRSA